MTLIVAVGFAIFSCGTGRESNSDSGIAGTYLKEYVFKVVNPETGIEVGMRTVRDTIIIRSLNDGFEVSNHKWALNDYDHEGWRTMQHSDNRPFQSFFGKYDSKSTALIADGVPKIYIDVLGRSIITDNKKVSRYVRIN